MPKTALVVAGDSPGSQLNERQRLFIEEYVNGPHRGHITKSYQRAYPDSAVSSASACGSTLLRDPRAAAYLAELQAQRREMLLEPVREWHDLVGEAQQVLIRVMRGEERSRLMLDAAREILMRALGAPNQRLEHQVVLGEKEVNRALLALAHRRIGDA